MPDTYTQEQIDEAKQFLLDSDTIKKHVTIVDDGEANTPVRIVALSDSLNILLSALSTAEKNNADWQEYNAELLHRAEKAEAERNAYRRASVQDYAKLKSTKEGYEFAKKMWKDFEVRHGKSLSERDTLKTQVAELEARLQKAAERAVEWYRREQIYEKRVDMAAVDESGLRAAIVGKKEG